MNSYVVNLYPKPNGTNLGQNLTVAGTVVSFTNDFDYKTNGVLVSVQTAPVFVTHDGSTPSSTNGHLLPIGYMDFWSKDRAIAAKFIRNGATSAVVNLSQFTN